MKKFKYLAVPFDLDVLSSKGFRSIYPTEPYTKAEDFPAAVGEMKLAEVVCVRNEVSEQAEFAGLGIAEHLPWDEINLRRALSEVSIFND